MGCCEYLSVCIWPEEMKRFYSNEMFIWSDSQSSSGDVDRRLAAIDGDDGYTGVKPQHRYVTCPLWHRPSPSFRFFL